MTNFPRSIPGAVTALLGIGLALGAAPVRAADWPLLRGNVQRSSVAEEKLAPPLSLLWRFTAAPHRNNPCAPAIVGDTVYFASGETRSGGGVVYAVDVRTGAQKWRYPSQGTLGSQTFQTAPLVEGGNVYIGASDGNLYVLRAQDGELLRTFRTGGPITASPVIFGGVLYFGSNDDTLYALDPNDGRQVWPQPYKARDNINSAPVIGEGMIFTTSSDQHVHAVNLTGKFRWQFRLPFATLPNGLVFAGNTLFVPAGSRLLALTPRSGNQRWMQTLPADIAAPPVAEGGVVYVTDGDRNLYALRDRDGREVWEKPIQLPYEAAAAPTIAGDVIYVPTVRNVVYALSREDGRTLWYYSIDPSTSQPRVAPPTYTALAAPMAIANGALYVLSDDGSLSAFRPDAIDTTPPLAARFFPVPGSLVSGTPPLVFAAELYDPGSGIDKDSVKITLDDQALEATYDASRDLIYYRTSAEAGAVNPPMANGRHTVTLTARDWRGNAREEKWSFVVDNSLPAMTNRGQQAPAAPRTPAAPGGVARPGTQPGARPGPGGVRPAPGARPAPGSTRPGGGGRDDRRRDDRRRDRDRGGNTPPPPPPSPAPAPSTPPPAPPPL